MTLTIKTDPPLTITVDGEAMTPQNLARLLRLQGIPPEKCGALGRMLAAAAEVGFETLEAG